MERPDPSPELAQKTRAVIGAFLLVSTLVWPLNSFSASANAGNDDGDFTLNDIAQIIAEKKITRMEDLLAALPEDLRSNFTFMVNSRSIQGADLGEPRAILFGKTGKLILTFNGDPSQQGGTRIEALEATEERAGAAGNKTTSGFKTADIEFFPSSSGKQAEIHQNPASCKQCHGDEIHPIWTQYNQWTGAYGQDDDSVAEEPQYSSFAVAGNAKANPRYNKLIWKNDDPSWPYHSDSQTDRNLGHMPNARLEVSLAIRNAEAFASDASKNPYFSQLAYLLSDDFLCVDHDNVYSRLNQIGAAVAPDKRLHDQPDWFAALSDRDLYLRKRGEAVRVSNDLSQFNTGLVATLGPGYGYPMEMRYLAQYAILDQAARTDPELRAALDRARGTLAVLGQNDSVYDKLAKDTDSDFLKFVFSDSPDYLADKISTQFNNSSQTPPSNSGEVCKILKDRVKQILSKPFQRLDSACTEEDGPASAVMALAGPALQAAGMLRRDEDQKAQQILKTRGCVDCHDPSSGETPDAPAINFGNETLLQADMQKYKQNGKNFIDVVKARLAADAPDFFRMPYLGDPLSSQERNQLLDYFRSLSNPTYTP